MSTLYRKIDLIHRQCIAFAAERERNLPTMPLARLYIGVDRQDYMINGSDADDRRNLIFRAVGSADNTTGYVLGLHLNLDPSLDPDDLKRDAIASGDYEVRPAYRQHARLWLRQDYLDAIQKTRAQRFGIQAGSLRGSLLPMRTLTRGTMSKGSTIWMRILLCRKRVCRCVENTPCTGTFSFLGSFSIAQKRSVFFSIKTQPSGLLVCRHSPIGSRRDAATPFTCGSTPRPIDEKRQILADNRRRMAVRKQLHPDLEDWQVKLLMIKEKMAQMVHIGKWQDRWVEHPFPNRGEPEKAMCYLTDIQGYDEDHLAWLYHKASLHAIDRFFPQVRRR